MDYFEVGQKFGFDRRFGRLRATERHTLRAEDLCRFRDFLQPEAEGLKASGTQVCYSARGRGRRIR